LGTIRCKWGGVQKTEDRSGKKSGRQKIEVIRSPEDNKKWEEVRKTEVIRSPEDRSPEVQKTEVQKSSHYSEE
jgi:hypothetical protein